METDQITGTVIRAAITVHSELGPGLLESAYKACLAHELGGRGLCAVREVPVPVIYKGLPVDCGFRIDLLVEDEVIVELKAVERLAPVHEAQVITYLKLSNRSVGLLLNFNAPLLIEGLRRIVLGFPESTRRPRRPRR